MPDPGLGSESLADTHMDDKRSSRARGCTPAMLLLGFVAGLVAARRAPEPAADSRRIVHNASDAIISADEDNIIVMANPAAAAMFGTTVAEMRGKPLAS